MKKTKLAYRSQWDIAPIKIAPIKRDSITRTIPLA